jgi:uncharacterized integral membrane protein (TIGR00698 family)
VKALAAFPPRLALGALLVVGGHWLAVWTGESLLGYPKSPFSPVMAAILIGLLLANALPSLTARVQPVLGFCTTTVLRLGIVLLGLKLSLVAASTLGLAALPVVLTCITLALVMVIAAGRAIGLSRELGGLIAVGTSICGITAIAATAPLIRAREAEVSYASGCIALFGLAALLGLPAIAHALFPGNVRLAGFFLGTSVHDTSQVAGAALVYQQQYHATGALEVATVTKLVRNLCMVAVIPLIAVIYRERAHGEPTAAGSARAAAVPAVAPATAGRPSLVPLFVFGFVAMCALRTIGDIGARPFGLLSSAAWHGGIDRAQTVSEWALTIAMAAVGLQTRLTTFRALGWKPLVLGLIAAALVGCVSAGSLLLFY